MVGFQFLKKPSYELTQSSFVSFPHSLIVFFNLLFCIFDFSIFQNSFKCSICYKLKFSSLSCFNWNISLARVFLTGPIFRWTSLHVKMQRKLYFENNILISCNLKYIIVYVWCIHFLFVEFKKNIIKICKTSFFS